MIDLVRTPHRIEARFRWDPAVKDLVKAAGFRFDPNVKVWWTTDERVAAKVARPDAVDAINEDMRKAAARAIAAIEASRATSADVAIPAPEGLDYLGYQKAGIAYAMERPGTLIGDDMGLGKTMQAIGAINADPDARRVLIICPASLKLNWAKELKKWLVKSYAIVVASSKPTREVGEALIRAFALTDEVGADGGQEGDDVRSGSHRPQGLGLDALDRSSAQSLVGAPIDRSAERAEDRDHARVGVGYANAPRPVAGAGSIAADPAFAVNDAGHIGEFGGVGGHRDGRGFAAHEAHRRAGQAAEMVAQGSLAQAKRAGGFGGVHSALDALESSKQVSVSRPAGTCHGVILIMNYDIVSNWRDVIDAVDIHTLIIDECHYLKNPKAQRTKAVLGG